MLCRASFNPFGIGDSEMNSRSPASKSLVPVSNNRLSYPNGGENKQGNEREHYINGGSGALTQYRGTQEPMGYNAENRTMSYGANNSRPVSYQEECRPVSYNSNACPIGYPGGSNQVLYESISAPLQFGSNSGRQVTFESPGSPYGGTNNLMPYEGPTPIAFQGGNSLMPYEASTTINSLQGGNNPMPMGAGNLPVLYENSGTPLNFPFQGRGGPMSFGGSAGGEPLHYSGSTGSQTITADSRMINGSANPTSYCGTSAPLNMGSGSNRFTTNIESSGPLHFSGSGGPVPFGGLGVPLNFENSRNMPVVYEPSNFRGSNPYSSYASSMPDSQSMRHSSSNHVSHNASGYPARNSEGMHIVRASNSASYLNNGSPEYGVKRNGLSMPYMNIEYHNNSKRIMNSDRTTSLSPYNMQQNYSYGNSGYSPYMR